MLKNKNLIVLSSPSGGGKSTVAHHLLRIYSNVRFSVSATTRSIRTGEQNGREYFFLTKEEFQNKIDTNQLVEYEEIFGNFYGTLRSEIDNALKANECLIFDVDVKGAFSIKKAFPEDSILIFLTPPATQVLEERLRNRKTETDEQIVKRLERAEFEIAQSSLFDFTIVNNELENTLKNAEALVEMFTDAQRI